MASEAPNVPMEGCDVLMVPHRPDEFVTQTLGQRVCWQEWLAGLTQRSFGGFQPVRSGERLSKSCFK